MVDPKILEVVPLWWGYPIINFIELSNSSNFMGDSRRGVKDSEGPEDEEKLEVGVEDNLRANIFTIDIMELGRREEKFTGKIRQS